MRELTIKCVDAFSSRSFAGNPAGIIDGADGLSTEIMRAIAGQMLMNIIECGFVMRPRSHGATAHVRYFTPTREFGCSGHVTIAACHSLVEDGAIPLEEGVRKVLIETGMGDVAIDLRGVARRSGAVDLEAIMMHQPVQALREARLPVDELAAILGIDSSEIARAGLPPMVASADVDWLIIPVRGKETVLTMQPDLIKLGIFDRAHGVMMNHVFTLDTFDGGCAAYARHFGPAMGLWEDPATAMAAGGLAVYLVRQGVTTTNSLEFEQGNDAERLARLRVEVDHGDGAVTGVRVGGLAATSLVKRITVEDDGTVTAG